MISSFNKVYIKQSKKKKIEINFKKSLKQMNTIFFRPFRKRKFKKYNVKK